RALGNRKRQLGALERGMTDKPSLLGRLPGWIALDRSKRLNFTLRPGHTQLTHGGLDIVHHFLWTAKVNAARVNVGNDPREERFVDASNEPLPRLACGIAHCDRHLQATVPRLQGCDLLLKQVVTGLAKTQDEVNLAAPLARAQRAHYAHQRGATN